MSEITFEDIKFEEQSGKVIVRLLKIFSTTLNNADLEKIGAFAVKDGELIFDNVSEKSALNKLLMLLQKAFEHLRNDVTGHSAVYIHRNSGIPLLGSAAFGIVDRNSSMIEVKPITGCNMNCIFCSVDEGLSSKKTNDFVVEEAYLVEECSKIVAFKKVACQIVINTHGESLLYSRVAELVKDLKAIPNVTDVSLITNGTLLTRELIDRLASAGLGSLNISVNAITPEKAKILQGTALYDAKKVQEMAEYAAKKVKVILAPVFVQGYNEGELKKIALFAKKIGAKTGIQNFLRYSGGRNPAQQLP
ncbi:MAG: radical SAM protein, partial [Candidatus Woesearchaeota archaeon]